jgi:hypothetical protein
MRVIKRTGDLTGGLAGGLVFAALFCCPNGAFAQGAGAEKVFSMALTGDSIITRKLSVFEEPEFLKMIELIRGADMAFTNLEMLFHDYEPFPMHESGGTYMRAEPALVNELVWAGFDMVSRANNPAPTTTPATTGRWACG